MIKTVLMKAEKVKERKIKDLTKRINILKTKNVLPNLVVIQVGEDKASSIYIKNKAMLSEKLGIKSTIIKLPNDIKISELENIIKKYNEDKMVHGILVQFPLPKKFNQARILRLINPHKDADGLNPLNLGLNFTNSNEFYTSPCTPAGILELLDFYNVKVEGMKVTVIGRSNIVGRPLTNMLINKNAVVTTLHTKVTKVDFANIIKSSDIIISAAGVKDLISPEMIKEGSSIIDVGIHKDENGKLRGDLKYENFIGKASHITTVPGGVGPMTVIMLMENIVILAENTIPQAKQ